MKNIITISILLFCFTLSSQTIVTSVKDVAKLKCGQSVVVIPFELKFDERTGEFTNMIEFEKASDEIWEALAKIKCGSVVQHLPPPDTEWDEFVKSLQTLSAAKFNSKYKEKDLVAIAMRRPDLPDFLKSTAGKKSDKVNWYQENKKEIENY